MYYIIHSRKSWRFKAKKGVRRSNLLYFDSFLFFLYFYGFFVSSQFYILPAVLSDNFNILFWIICGVESLIEWTNALNFYTFEFQSSFFFSSSSHSFLFHQIMVDVFIVGIERERESQAGGGFGESKGSNNVKWAYFLLLHVCYIVFKFDWKYFIEW